MICMTGFIIKWEAANNMRDVSANKIADKKAVSVVIKEKVLMNTSFVWGVAFGLFAEKFLVGSGGNPGIVFYIIKRLFS